MPSPHLVWAGLFTWFRVNSLKAVDENLGIQIPASASQLYSLNFLPLFHKIQSDLDSQELKRFSWFGRLNILKMDILTRLQYLFQMIPIHLPCLFFRKLHWMFSNFIWNSVPVHSRICFRMLTLLKHCGGVGVPDNAIYHKAAIFTCILDWFHHSPSKTMGTTGGHMNPIDFCVLLWILPAVCKTSLNSSRSYLPNTQYMGQCDTHL